MKYRFLIWSALRRNPVRTTMTMCSIATAFLLFGVMQGINQGLDSAVNDLKADRIWTSSRNSFVDSLPIAHIEGIRRVPGVVEVAQMAFFGGYYQDARNSVPSYATNVDALARVYPELHISAEQLEAMRTIRTGVLVSRSSAEQHGWKVGDRVPLGSSVWPQSNGSTAWLFDVVGVVEAPELFGSPLADASWVNYSYFDEARMHDQGRVHLFTTMIADATAASRISAAIDKLNENSRNETRTQSEKAILQTILKQIADIGFIVNSVVGASFFTLLFVIGNAMMQSLRERISEFAVLKTIGFSSKVILAMVLTEASLVCVAPAMLGLLLTIVLMPVVGEILGLSSLPPVVLVEGLGLACGLALLAGLPIALNASRVRIVDALSVR